MKVEEYRDAGVRIEGDWTEHVNGSFSQIICTVGAAAVNPLLGIIPILTSTLAGGRHNKRVEDALNAILTEMSSLRDQLDSISDPSFKLINDAILCIPHAVQDKKIDHLKACIRGAIKNDRLTMHEATALGRVLRDISVEEANFLVNKIDSYVHIGGRPDTDKFTLGLRSLGLLINHTGVHGSVIKGGDTCEFTPLAHRLAELLQ